MQFNQTTWFGAGFDILLNKILFAAFEKINNVFELTINVSSGNDCY